MASSFSRKAVNANDGKSKKIIMVAVLGAVFVFVLIHQFGGAKTTDAAATETPQAIAPEAATETPAQVLLALEDRAAGKSASLTAKELSALTMPPTDPFRVSEKWIAILYNERNHQAPVNPPAPPTSPIPEPPSGTKEPTPPAPPVVPTVKWEPSGLKLASIWREGNKIHAFINSTVVDAGDVIAGGKIIEITGDRVTVQQDGNPKAQLYSLTINRPGK